MGRDIFVEPSHRQFLGDQYFEAVGPPNDRDNQLAPNKRLRAALQADGHRIHTIDKWDGHSPGEYYSFGQVEHLKRALSGGLTAKAYLLLEPPTNAGEFYRKLPELGKTFETVYLFNTVGDGYSLEGVEVARLRRLRFPQPQAGVMEPHWSNRDRIRKMVVINANKRPWFRGKELYSERIRAVAELSKQDAVDLYGYGWNKVLLGDRYTLRQFFWPQLRHFLALQRAYRGPVTSKYEVLARHDFALCLENCRMAGYVTEKIFDCLYAGAVPCYLGAPDVSELVPRTAFVNAAEYDSWTDLWVDVRGFDRSQIDEYRAAGRQFLESRSFREQFHESLIHIFGLDPKEP